MSDDDIPVAIIDISEWEDGDWVPEGVIGGIEALARGETASKEEIEEAFLSDGDDDE